MPYMAVEHLRTGSEVRAFAYEDLEKRFEPLIFKFSKRAISVDLDPEDVAQELRVRLWKAWQRYSPEDKTGYLGRSATFTNYVIHIFENCLHNLHRTVNHKRRVVRFLGCDECGMKVAPPLRIGAACGECGGRRWTATMARGPVSSLDALMDDTEDGFGDHLAALEQSDPDWTPEKVEGALTAEELIELLPPRVRICARSIIIGLGDQQDFDVLRTAVESSSELLELLRSQDT